MAEDQRDKIVALLQFARKANKLILGHDAALKNIKNKKVEMIILALDLSENRQKSIRENTKGLEIDIVNWGTKDLFEQIFDKYVGIISITDTNFKNGLKQYFSSKRQEVEYGFESL